MLRTSVKKAVGWITAGVAAVILVAAGASFVGQPAWAEGVSSDDWVVDGGTKGLDWDTDRTGTLTFKQPGSYTVERTGDTECRIHFAETFDTRTTLTLGNVNCKGNETGAGLDPNGSGVTLVLAGNAQFRGGGGQPGVRAEGADAEHGVEIASVGQGGLASGSLTANGGNYAAGIGGGYKAPGRFITVSGGTVTATGGIYAAGIGGGQMGSGSNIAVTGGMVITKGHTHGAGIGGGQKGSGSDIRITGGTVTATGGELAAAGIGGGSHEGDGSNIEVAGGVVTATGGEKAAGIGGGEMGSGSDIRITGGTVTATGGEKAAGIGGGKAYFGSGKLANGSDITISGGHVTASGGAYGAGIGGGQMGSGSDIRITGGTVTATGGKWADGIGGGFAGSASEITVSGGSVKASSVSSPKDQGGQDLALLTVPAPNASEINLMTVDSPEWKRAGNHPDNDGAWYAWVSKKAHKIVVGNATTCYAWTGSGFQQGKCEQMTPPAPVKSTAVGSRSSVSVSVSVEDADQAEKYGGLEYSIDGGKTWQESNTFTQGTAGKDLSAGTEYMVLARYKGNGKFFPSDSVEVRVSTAPDLPAPSGSFSATSGQKLEQVTEPNGWSWVDDTKVFDENPDTASSVNVDATKTITAPEGQSYAYTTADLPQDADCKFSGESTGGSVTVICPVSVNLSRVGNKWTAPVDIHDWDFGEAAIEPSVKSEYGTVEYSYSGTLAGGTGYGPSPTAPTQVGTYTVTATVAAGKTDQGVYYAGLDGSSALTDTFTIGKGGNKWDTNPAIAGWTYGDAAPVPTPGKGEFGGAASVKYRPQQDGEADTADQDDATYEAGLKGVSYSDELPTQAGDYVMVSSVEGTDDYKGLVKRTFFTIGQADPKVAITMDPSKHYDGKVVAAPEFSTLGTVTDAAFTWFVKDESAQDGWRELASAPKDVGSYKVVASVAAGGNYAAGSGYRPFTISENTKLVVALGGKLGKTYDGQVVEAPAVEVSGAAQGDPKNPEVTLIWEQETEPSVWHKIDAAPKDAGSYRVSAQVSAANYESKTSEVLDFVIDQADSTVIIDAIAPREWDGRPQAEPTYRVAGSSGAVSVAWFDDKGGLLASAPSDAGTYQVKVSVADDVNFKADRATAGFVIGKAPAMVTGLEAVGNLVFTGSPQALVTAPAVTGGVVEYAVGATRPADDSQAWSRELPKTVDAGEYTVFWRVVPDGNHTSIGGDVQVKVAAAEPAVSAKPAREIRFGQKFADAGVATSAELGGKPVEGTVAWVGVDRELLAGTHEFTGTFTPKDTKNFKAVPVTVTLQVNSAPATVAGLKAVGNLVFNGQPQALVTTPTVVGGTVEYAVGSTRPTDDSTSWSANLPKVTDAGEYTVFWRVVPDRNHTAIGGDVRVKVAAAQPTVTAQPAHPITFGQKFADAGVTVASVFDGKPVKGATQWADTDRELAAGTHKFTGTFTPTDTKNFTPVPVTVTVQVDKASAMVSGLEAVKDLVYTGAPHTLVTAPTVTGGTVEYAVAATRPADDSTSWSAELPKATHAGDYTVFWRVVPDGNHTSIDGNVQVKVAAVGPTVTAKPARVLTFGQTFADAGVAVSAELGGKPVEGTTEWADTDRELTLGVHEFTGTFTPKDTKNFKAVPVTVTVQVDKAPAMVFGLEAVKDLVFNGQPQTVVTAPTVVGGTIEYAVGVSQPSSPDAWEQVLPVGSHAGSATVFWRVIPDSNHTEVHGQVPVVIAPKVAATDGQLAHGFSFAAENGEYVIRDGQTRLSFGTDYTFELVNASFESQTADVEITFKGDYTGFAVVKNAMATEWGGVGPVEWKPGSGNVSLDLGEGSSPVTSVQVDDKPLDQGKFHRSDDGKLVVDTSVLERLAPGDHTLEVRLEDGSVIVYPLRVLPADKPTPLFTGEWLAWLLTWPILLWLVLRTFAPWTLPFFLK